MRKVQNLPSLSLKWTISESIPGSRVASLRAEAAMPRCVFTVDSNSRGAVIGSRSHCMRSTPVLYTIRTGFEQAFDRNANIEYAVLGLGVLEI